MRWVRGNGNQIAHIYFNDASLLMPPFLRVLAGVRVVVSRRDLGIWYTPARLRVLRLVRYFVSRVVANSKAVAAVVIRSEKYPPAKLEVIYNGISLAVHDPQGSVGAQPGKESEFRIILAANLRPVKGVGNVIRALSFVRTSIPSVRLLVVGADRPGIRLASHREELEGLAQELGVSDLVTFLGQYSDPLSVASQCHVGVLCSESEGLSNAVMEYMLAGLPVVCTPVGGNVELVEQDVTGLLVAPADVEGLAAALIRLSSEPDLARSMGAKARERIREDFSESQMIASHERLYVSLATRRPSSWFRIFARSS